jgi:hypothetical protein
MSVQILCDLRTQLGTVRDQDQRPTCLAFAASDAHAALRSPWAPLSVEFAFYHAQRRAGRSPHVGATLPAILDALREDGQPIEAGWPYLTAIPADWKPSSAVGPLFRRQGHEGGSTFAEIIGRLDENKPALVLLTLSPAFDLANPSNDVVDEKPGEQSNPARRHAVVAVGYGVLAGQKVRAHPQDAESDTSDGRRVETRLWSMEDVAKLCEPQAEKRGTYKPRQPKVA